MTTLEIVSIIVAVALLAALIAVAMYYDDRRYRKLRSWK